MDKVAAERECRRLRDEHPDRASNTWVVREAKPEAGGQWEVVRVPLPAGIRRDPLKATVEAKPKPAQSDDVPLWQSSGVPPYAAG